MIGGRPTHEVVAELLHELVAAKSPLERHRLRRRIVDEIHVLEAFADDMKCQKHDAQRRLNELLAATNTPPK